MSISPKISVIVPLYNCESYIERSISSIINQSYKDIEILVIDDGSTDGSASIIENNYSKNSNIKYFYKNNSGVADARNLGIEKAVGEFLFFLDADDWIEHDCLESLVSFTEEDSLDFAFSLAHYVASDDFLRKKILQLTSEDKLVSDIISQKIPAYCWGNLYKRQIIKSFNLKFHPGLKMMEDIVFNLNYIFKCNAVGLCRIPKYYYFQRKDSAVKTISIDKINDQFKALDIVKCLLKETGDLEFFQKEIKNWYLNNKVSFVNCNINTMKKWDDFYEYSFFDVLRSNMSFLKKIFFIMMELGFYRIVYFINFLNNFKRKS